MVVGRCEIELIYFNISTIGKDLLYRWCDNTSYMCNRNGSLYYMLLDIYAILFCSANLTW